MIMLEVTQKTIRTSMGIMVMELGAKKTPGESLCARERYGNYMKTVSRVIHQQEQSK